MSTINKITFTALFAGLTAAGSFAAIPMGPVPFTLQNLFALLGGLVLGPVLGAAAVGLFLIAGIIGAPVFANNAAGFAQLLGPTGGYLFGYLLGAAVAGLIAGSPRSGITIPLWRLVVAVIAGFLVVYVPGLIRLRIALDAGWARTFAVGFFPFLIGDAIKAVAAVLIAPRLRRFMGNRE